MTTKENITAAVGSLVNHPTCGSCKIVLSDGETVVMRNIFTDREYTETVKFVSERQADALAPWRE